MKFLSIYKTCVKTAVAQAAAYRFDFFLSLVITFADASKIERNIVVGAALANQQAPW